MKKEKRQESWNHMAKVVATYAMCKRYGITPPDFPEAGFCISVFTGDDEAITGMCKKFVAKAMPMLEEKERESENTKAV